MKVTILHDFLDKISGTEKVLSSLLKIYPNAQIYTLVAENSIIETLGLDKTSVHQSIISCFPIFKFKTSIMQIISLKLWSSFNLEKFDLIISSSSTGLSNLVNTGNVPYINYIHCLPKNLFNRNDHLFLQKLIPFHHIYSSLYEKAIKSSKHILTNSNFMKVKLNKLFGVTATVIYPPVLIPKISPKLSKREYYLSVGRLDKNKSIDLAIHACNRLKLQFKIIGIGPEMEILKKIAGPTIEFLDFVPDEKLIYYYQKAIAFIFCAKDEEFGIAPIEALSHGIPVIAYYGGGAKETLKENVTGNFFYNHNSEMLIKSLIKFRKQSYDPNQLYNYSKRFSEDMFIHNLKNYISSILK